LALRQRRYACSLRASSGWLGYTAFVQAAVYDAVVGVEGRYEPYRFHAHAPHGTSAQAAAVAAAHKVLVTYVPSGQAALDAAYAASLAQLPDGKAKTGGAAFGILAAENLIRLRANDGRNAPSCSPSHRRRGSGDQPHRDSCRCRHRGSASSRRCWSGAPPSSPHRLRRRSPQRATPVTSTRSRRSARPIPPSGPSRRPAPPGSSPPTHCAVQRRIARSTWPTPTATVADPTWAPLLATPPYPDYPSGYNAFNSTVSHGLEDLFQTRHLQLTLISTAVPGVQRHHDSGRVLRQDVVDAMDARPLLPARPRARAIVNPCRCLLWRVPELVATPREGRSCSGPWVATGRHGVVPSPGGCRCAEGGTPDRCPRDHPARPGVKLERPQPARRPFGPSQPAGAGGRGWSRPRTGAATGLSCR
jgi:hypothetical protein